MPNIMGPNVLHARRLSHTLSGLAHILTPGRVGISGPTRRENPTALMFDPIPALEPAMSGGGHRGDIDRPGLAVFVKLSRSIYTASSTISGGSSPGGTSTSTIASKVRSS